MNILAEIKIKNEIEQLLLKYKHGNNIHETENSKTNEPHKSFPNLPQRLEPRTRKYVKGYGFLSFA